MKLTSFIMAIFAMIFLTLPAQAFGHGGAYEELADATGIRISPLVHGQMTVLSDNHGAILALAKQHRDDPVMAQLLSFEFKQRALAGFGLVPVAVSDANQFLHQPTHGYLAATRAMLVRMQKLAPNGSAEAALADQVDVQMIAQSGTSLSLCEYSAMSFVTTETYGPDWSKLTLETLAIPLLLLAGAVFMLLLWASGRNSYGPPRLARRQRA